jgi:hypothetical protein
MEEDEEDYPSDPDSDVVLEEEDNANEEDLEDEDDGVNDSNSIYPILIIDPKSVNPDTGKKWLKKEINARMRNHIESRWTDEPTDNGHTPFIFTGAAPGPVGVETTALGVFERFLNDDLVSHIVQASNEYSLTDRYKSRRQKTGPYCKALTKEAFYLWVAVTLLVSLHGKANVQDNWATEEILKTPIFSALMSVDRYLYICSILHTGKKSAKDDANPIWKSQFIVDSLNKSFESSYNLEQEISIDESLMLYRGHHSLIRYIPNKAAKFGFKIYAVASSDTGYLYRFFFDAGEKTRLHQDCPKILNKPGNISIN